MGQTMSPSTQSAIPLYSDTSSAALAAMSLLGWSPPSTPDQYEIPVIPTNARRMASDSEQSPRPSRKSALHASPNKRRKIQYVSRHFVTPPTTPDEGETKPTGKRRKSVIEPEDAELPEKDTQESVTTSAKAQKQKPQAKRLKSGESSGEIRIKYGEGATRLSLIRRKARFTSKEAKLVATNASGPALLEHTEHRDKKEGAELPRHLNHDEGHGHYASRIYFGLNVDELSSDSDLTDVPADLGPDPFASSFNDTAPRPTKKSKRKSTRILKAESQPAEVLAVKEKKPKKNVLTKSPYFPHPHKQRPTFLSTLPFPPLYLERFGLMQERLCHDPFRLLLATIFLNKTPGSRAMPVFFKLMEQYPTPEALAAAEQTDVTAIIQQLGFQNQRARKCIAMARRWVEDPPVKGRRWRKADYPRKGDGKDVKVDEVVDDEDERVAWEISHLTGLGPYSHDSWRMFCRDELRGLASAYNGEDAGSSQSEVFEPEWKRVLPTDKELRAWMTWMWMKEGWVWNKETGERTKASDELMKLASGKGNVVLEDENNTLKVKSLDDNQPSPLKLRPGEKKDVRVEVPAGDFMPASGQPTRKPAQSELDSG